jgi:putative FmdB family regulatory protein
MPLYEYECQHCGLRYERIEHASALHNGTCPECGHPTRRLLSAPALQFKGSGWYVNDYGKGKASMPSESEKPASETTKPDTPAKSEKKTETKKPDPKVA